MFESITITKHDKPDGSPELDFGFLLECLLFYQKVHLIVGEKALLDLIRCFGEDLLCILLDDGVLSVHYDYEQLAIMTKKKRGIEMHSPATFHSPDHTLGIALSKAVVEREQSQGKTRRRSLRLQPKIKVLKRGDELVEAAKDRLSESSFVTSAADIVFKTLMPAYQKPIKFECIRSEDGFVVETDIAFGFVNAVRRAANQPELTAAHLLSAMCRVETDLSLAAAHLSEIATHDLGAKLIKLRFAHLARRFEKSEDVRTQFGEVVLGEAKALRYALDPKHNSLQEIVEAILAAKPFKDWLAKQEPHEDVVRQYYKDVATQSVFDKLPGKTARWSICAGLGLAADLMFSGGLGTLAGNAIGALDTFYLDRFVKGWKPNHFVEDKLVPLIKAR